MSQQDTFRSSQSLGLITQRFMNLKHENENQILNLNDVARELNISKRRVYDVINVLEGLGHVQKVEKNSVRWIKGKHGNDEASTLELEVEALRDQEEILDLMTRDCQALLKLHYEDPMCAPYNYIQKSDLKGITKGSKSIILKPKIDSCNNFEIQVAKPETASSTYQMIVKNRLGVESNALLYLADKEVHENGEQPSCSIRPKVEIDDEHEFVVPQIDNDQEDNQQNVEGFEDFVLPSSSPKPLAPQGFQPETPGRGLYLSPLRTVMDPNYLMSFLAEDRDLIPIEPPQQEDLRPWSDRNDMVSIFDLFDQ